VPLHQQSHGQSFLALASNRFAGDSLYVLDEPEAALSVSGALALLAIPGARIYELDGHGLASIGYDDHEAVRFTRGFLEAPERFIRAALGE
jgi:predicted ATPase